MGGGGWDSRVSTVVRGVLWVGSIAGLHVFGDVVIGVMWAVLLVLFVVVVFSGFAAYFLFSRVVLSRFVALSHKVVLRGHGR